MSRPVARAMPRAEALLCRSRRRNPQADKRGREFTIELLKYTAQPSKGSSTARDGGEGAHLQGKPEVHGLNRVTPAPRRG